MAIEKIVKKLKENSRPDTTWFKKAKKRQMEDEKELKEMEKLKKEAEKQYKKDKLKAKKQALKEIEKELSKVRTSTMQDGWQTEKHAKKSRKWDFLAQEKMKLRNEIEELKSNLEHK